MFKKMFRSMRQNADRLNKKNILRFLEKKEGSRLLDLGCDDGRWTLKLAEELNPSEIHGFDIVLERLEEAKRKGINVSRGDLNSPFNYEDDFFDCVHANQVIEHLHDTDNFVKETYRVLRKGGYCIISTENLSSWCNIFSLLFGWQPFSLTNISNKKLGMGNPFALNKGQVHEYSSWLHLRVMSVRALRELFEAHGFEVEKVTGAGYFPLPAVLGKLDVRHSHFITLKARKL